MSQITLTSPFQSLVNSRWFHRSLVRQARNRHSDVQLPTRGSRTVDSDAMIRAQARLFTALR
jgi:hypothetical protein